VLHSVSHKKPISRENSPAANDLAVPAVTTISVQELSTASHDSKDAQDDILVKVVRVQADPLNLNWIAFCNVVNIAMRQCHGLCMSVLEAYPFQGLYLRHVLSRKHGGDHEPMKYD
jgi:hypothetical protein